MRFPAVVVVLTLALAACGSSGGDGAEVATGGKNPSASASATPKSGDDKDAPVRYSQCMREHGVPKFPDPVQNEGGGVSLDLPPGVDKKALDAANATCKSLLPNGGEPVRADPKALEQ